MNVFPLHVCAVDIPSAHGDQMMTLDPFGTAVIETVSLFLVAGDQSIFSALATARSLNN